jgi:preprotein translocase subunit SecD
MKTPRIRFNTYLVVLVLSATAGCKSPAQRKHDQTLATLRLHLEVPPDSVDNPSSVQRVLGRSEVVEIAGARISVNDLSFLDEAFVERAAVVDTRDGGFAMQVQFIEHGRMVIESITTENPNRHIGILSRWGIEDKGTQRWLAAPVINGQISDGILLFTPNTSREEADEIALGLNNVAKKRKKQTALFDLGTGFK